VAQAVGRWGNWFNQELFGTPSTLPWAVEIDLDHRPAEYLDVSTFHPTFLYESLWMLAVAGVLVLVDRRWRLGHGRVFALYVALYTVVRFPIELIRIDPANEVAGLRVNVWVSLFVFVGAVAYLVLSARARPGREAPEELLGDRATDSGTGEDDETTDHGEGRRERRRT
jgi:prolipoprotein diacylglyceryl transferase